MGITFMRFVCSVFGAIIGYAIALLIPDMEDSPYIPNESGITIVGALMGFMLAGVAYRNLLKFNRWFLDIISKSSGLKILGILIGAAGAVILIINSGRISFHPEYLKGDLFILINTFAYAVFLVMIKPLLSKYSTITLMKWVYLAGAIVVLPYGYSDVIAVDYQSLTIIPILSILYIIIAITFLAYLLSAFALQRLSPPVVSFYVYLQPLSAAFIALILGKEVLNYYQLIAAVFIFAGVYFVSRK